MRVKFEENKQREFIKGIMFNTNCPSLKELSKRLDLNYSTMKNYFSELRLLPQEVFESMCMISEFDKNKIKIKILNDNWGQIKGGKNK